MADLPDPGVIVEIEWEPVLAAALGFKDATTGGSGGSESGPGEIATVTIW